MSFETQINIGVSKFKNIMGISCYMNSILHILQQTPTFLEYISQCHFRNTILKKMESIDDNKKESYLKSLVIFELFRLFKTSLENNDISITPTSFKKLIGIKNNIWNEMNHQDSQEFFNFLISQLEEEVGQKCTFVHGKFSDFNFEQSFDYSFANILATKAIESFQSKEFSPIKYMFNGMTTTNKKCSYCSSISYSFEPFVSLPITIPDNDDEKIICNDIQYSIYQCLDYMIQDEQLDSNNMYICDMCGIKNRSYNKTLLWQTPKILVIHIKRFKINNYGIPIQKLTNNIEYPINNLDLSKYFNPHSPFINSSTYDLIGVNIHHAFSNNINSGHYTSFVKNIINHHWYHYNDASPLEILNKSEQIQNKNAYLLFYYRNN